MNLLPMPKTVKKTDGFFKGNGVSFSGASDERINNAVKKLPKGDAVLNIAYGDGGEGYSLSVSENKIDIKAEGAAGAFYGIQTLRQLFKEEKIPCVYIEDKPDFEYRGFYHDITRGKVPTVETMKRLIDELAYFKQNSFQLYIEHTFAFKEFVGTGFEKDVLTAEEIRELDEYCYDNFIEFVPSIATFGHLYELLNLDKYKHLCVSEQDNFIRWRNRLRHHTVDPTKEESFELIKSLIDQFMPLFKHTNRFNICGDETFDLENKHGEQAGKLYVDFVNRIIRYVESKGKKAMMWGDILLKHPDVINDLPEQTELLNWCYTVNPDPKTFEIFAKSGRTQIVCPGTSTWSRLCENITEANINISKMAENGYKNGAIGVLNTNWGDYGNPCSVELAMHGMAVGAEKSWSVNTCIDGAFDKRVDALVYETDGASELVKRVGDLHSKLVRDWNGFVHIYSNMQYETKLDGYVPEDKTIIEVQEEYKELSGLLSKPWGNDEYREELKIALDGIELINEWYGADSVIEKLVDTDEWLSRYSAKWLAKNKENELGEIVKMFEFMKEHKLEA